MITETVSKSQDKVEQAPTVPSTGTVSCEELIQRLFNDIHEMLDFSRAEGRPLSAELRAKVEQLCSDATREKESQVENVISHLKKESSLKEPFASGMVKEWPLPRKEKRPNVALAFEVHGELTQIVSPATPRTIRASRPSAGQDWRLGANNKTVKLLLWASIISLLHFIPVAFLVQADTKMGIPEHVLKWFPVLMTLTAASIGSAFYGLYTAHKYLVNFTFDPKYHQVYVIRFVLGLSAGTILGHFGKDLFGANANGAKELAPAVLALVGGYAAEAVSQILQRFSDTLITMVRGSNRDALTAKQEEMKAQSKQQEIVTKGQASDVLRDALKALNVQDAGSAAAAIEKGLASLKSK
jgi:hypothetical protein